MVHTARLYDRSRVTTDWTCPRKRFWNYEYKGRGIVPATVQYELYMGTLVHDALSAIATQQFDLGRDLSVKDSKIDIDLIASTARDQMFQALMEASSGENEWDSMAYANEQGALVEGMIRGFYRSTWPSLMRSYPTIRLIEAEVTYEHDGLTFMSRPDLVLQDREGNLFYIEYKTTSSKTESWINSWNTAVQLHSTIKAIERTLGEKVTGVLVQGLYKGYQSYNKQSSPFCYAYMKKGVPPFSDDIISYEYKSGLKRTPVWELPGGVKAWVEGMPDDVLASQFPQSPPILVKDDMIDAFFKQRDYREHEIWHSMREFEEEDRQDDIESIMNQAFPQKFEACYPSFGGKPCTYRNLCFGNVKDPLTQGYQFRESHHDLEKEQHAGEI